jgi:hypothetical protein
VKNWKPIHWVLNFLAVLAIFAIVGRSYQQGILLHLLIFIGILVGFFWAVNWHQRHTL